MKRRILKIVKQILFYLFLVVSLIAGIGLYRVFMAYVPGADFMEVFTATLGMSPFVFFGIMAGILIVFPIILGALELYANFATSYIIANTDKGVIHLSDNAIESFAQDTISQVSGVDSVDVSIAIMKENSIGIRVWLYTDEKNDFVRFSERIQQRLLQDLEFNFGIDKINYFKVFLESTDIESAAKGYKVEYK